MKKERMRNVRCVCVGDLVPLMDRHPFVPICLVCAFKSRTLFKDKCTTQTMESFQPSMTKSEGEMKRTRRFRFEKFNSISNL